jgi:protein PhnA
MNTPKENSLQSSLAKRAQSSCELCLATSPLSKYAVIKRDNPHVDQFLCICATCQDLLDTKPFVANNHWKCLQKQIQEPLIPLQIMLCRILTKLETQQVEWAEDLLDQLFFGIDILDLADENYL